MSRQPFNWQSVRAVAIRDLTIVRRSKSVLLPIVLVPLLLLVLIPAGIGLASSRIDMGSDIEDMAQFLAMMPAPMKAKFAVYSDNQMMVVFILVYMFAPLFLVLPMMTASAIAAGSFAGEKERKTLEALLYTPTTDLELVVGKMLSAFVPAILVTLCGFVLYGLVVNLTAGQTMGGVFFPNAMWITMILWLAPAAAALGLGAMVLVSSKVSTYQDAYQLGGMVVLPVILLVLGQIGGVIYLNVGFVLLAGLVLWGIDAVILWFAVKTFRRTEIIARL
ncbi:MAG: ABC transporter permease subunit [Anaerolineae bacterium]|nr:ABC transporter permease subunit [Anaerolineae bacterium]